MSARERESGVPERTLRRKVARFDAIGMRSPFEPESDRRVLPLGIRRAIVELKAEYPPLGPFAIARICRHRFDHPVSDHTVRQVLVAEPLPLASLGRTVTRLSRGGGAFDDAVMPLALA